MSVELGCPLPNRVLEDHAYNEKKRGLDRMRRGAVNWDIN
jgi:hypothetical protein